MTVSWVASSRCVLEFRVVEAIAVTRAAMAPPMMTMAITISTSDDPVSLFFMSVPFDYASVTGMARHARAIALHQAQLNEGGSLAVAPGAIVSVLVLMVSVMTPLAGAVIPVGSVSSFPVTMSSMSAGHAAGLPLA